MSLVKELLDDTRFYHGLRFPGREATPLGLARVAASSAGLWALAAHRVAHGYTRRIWGNALPVRLAHRLLVHAGAYLCRALAKSEILAVTRIDPGVYLSDRGHIILGASSVGSGTVIHERVTIGMGSWDKGIPEIGGNVWIGPRSVIYGSIKIGAGATILPDTVVTKSLPPGTVVQGNPARVLRRDFDNAQLRSTPSPEAGGCWSGVDPA